MWMTFPWVAMLHREELFVWDSGFDYMYTVTLLQAFQLVTQASWWHVREGTCSVGLAAKPA